MCRQILKSLKVCRNKKRLRITGLESRRSLHVDLNRGVFHYDADASMVIGKMDKLCMYDSAFKFRNKTLGMCSTGGKMN